MNFTGTSPTYSNTPVYLQAGKFFFISLIFLYFICKYLIRNKLPKINNLFVCSLYSSLFFIPMFYAFVSKNTYLFTVGFFFILPIMIHLFFPNGTLNINKFSNVTAICLSLFILIDFVQFLLFITIGRLPALAYENSLSVRFGSVLDDPNGFGVLLTLFFPFVLQRYFFFKKLLLIILLVICLIATQSLTAFLIVPFSILLVSTLNVRFDYKIIFGTVFIMVILSTILYINYDIIKLLIDQKMQSVSLHADALNIASDTDIISYFGLSPSVSQSESGYINVLTSLGVLYFCLFLIAGIIAIKELVSLLFYKIDRLDKSVVIAFLTFLVAFYLSLFNLPFEKVFPINALAYLVMGIVTSGSLRRGIVSKKYLRIDLSKM